MFHVKHPMPKHQIELIARGVLVRDNRLLLCQNIANGHQFLPGGHVEFGESASDALVREMMEETGTEVAVGPLVGVFEASFDQPRSDKPPRRHHEVNLIFEMSPIADGAGFESQEAKIQFIWIDLSDPSACSKVLPTGIMAVATGPDILSSCMSE